MSNEAGEGTTGQPRVRVTKLAPQKPIRQEAIDKYVEKRPKDTAMPRDDNLFARPIYDGKELRPFTGRPGAMDAAALPSRGL